jgi:hypothetical protein
MMEETFETTQAQKTGNLSCFGDSNAIEMRNCEQQAISCNAIPLFRTA